MSEEKKPKRQKNRSRSGWKFTILEVLAKLRKYGIYDYLEEVIENDDENAAIFVISHNRFYKQLISVNRFSVSNYHVNFGCEHYIARAAKDAAKIIRDIILRELPPEEDDEDDNMRYMRKTGYNRR